MQWSWLFSTHVVTHVVTHAVTHVATHDTTHDATHVALSSGTTVLIAYSSILLFHTSHNECLRSYSLIIEIILKTHCIVNS